MDIQWYRRYLDYFNARNYDGVLANFADAFDLSFAGYHFRTKEEVRRFYQFFHEHVDEAIDLKAFVGNAEMVAIEVIVKLTGKKELTPAALEKAGYGRLVPLAVGQVVEIPQYIHYHLRDGKIVAVGCAMA